MRLLLLKTRTDMNLSKQTNKDIFLKTYYLKKELVKFCRENHLPTSRPKQKLTQIIYEFLDGKKINLEEQEKKIRIKTNSAITKNSIIDENYANDEKHRAFFLEKIGKHFKYNTPFMNWMKENKGKKIYQDAIDEWNRIYELKKSGFKYEIGSQFEYNNYTRSFFEANPNLSKEDCIKCWNYKKTKPGNHKYEKEDLEILNKE